MPSANRHNGNEAGIRMVSEVKKGRWIMAEIEISRQEQIDELRREIKMRKSVYPKWSKLPDGEMTAKQKRQIAVMESVLLELENLGAEEGSHRKGQGGLF